MGNYSGKGDSLVDGGRGVLVGYHYFFFFFFLGGGGGRGGGEERSQVVKVIGWPFPFFLHYRAGGVFVLPPCYLPECY